jgi:Icc protein
MKKRIIQISDLHLTPDFSHAYEVDVWQNTKDLLKHLKDLEFDLLVISGDICFRDGSREVYSNFNTLLDEIAQPKRIMAGNHDDRSLLQSHFPEAIVNSFKEELNSAQIIYIDSGSGRIESDPSILGEADLVFTHYPFLKTDSEYMDNNYRLENADQCVEQCKQGVHIFSGHYHQSKSVFKNGKTQHLCPSPFFTISPYSDILTIVHTDPSYRVIELDDQGGLSTWCESISSTKIDKELLDVIDE